MPAKLREYKAKLNEALDEQQNLYHRFSHLLRLSHQHNPTGEECPSIHRKRSCRGTGGKPRQAGRVVGRLPNGLRKASTGWRKKYMLIFSLLFDRGLPFH